MVRIALVNNIDQKTYGSAQVVAASACFAGFVVQTVFDEEWKSVRRLARAFSQLTFPANNDQLASW